MRVRSLAVALVPALLGLAACGHARKVPPPAPLPVERPLVGLAGVKVDGLGFSGVDLAFDCEIENPNPFPLSVAGVRYALAIEDRGAASGVIPAALAVPPATAEGPGRVRLAVPVEVRWATVPAVARLFALDREAAYALTGEIGFSTPGGHVAVPLHRQGTLAVPRAPRFHVERARIRASSPLEIVIEVAMGVRNPNPYALPPGRLHYGLFVTGREVAHTDVALADGVAAGGATDFVVPVKISTVKAGKAAARLMLPFASLDLAVRGEAVLGGVPVPLDLQGSLLPKD